MKRTIAILLLIGILGGWGLATTADYDCNGRTCPRRIGICSFLSCCGQDGQGCYMRCYQHTCLEWSWSPSVCGFPIPCCVEWSVPYYGCFESSIPEMAEPSWLGRGCPARAV